MITLAELTELLGWVSLLNLGMMVLASILLITMKSFMTSLHSKMFDIPENELTVIYFKYLAYYKILTFVVIIAPYVALKIMGQ